MEANNAIKIIIAHCPIAKKNNNKIENKILLETVAIAIILAKRGEEQGLAANANKQPTTKGTIKILPDLFCGIFLTIEGKLISIIPIRFKPKITRIEPNNNNNIGEAKEAKALPVKAHRIPMILKITDNPKEKESICKKSFLFPSLEYPPTYPIINGKIPKLQGDKEAITPAQKDAKKSIGINKEFALVM